jgi:type I restriction enzyme S subunit
MSKLSLSIPTTLVLAGDLRLDATYYGSLVFRAKDALRAYQDDGGTVTTIGGFSAGTFNPPPIKRAFTDDRLRGTPYMLPQEMYDFYWTPRKLVLAEKMPDIDDWRVKSGWVILSQSGTVGKPYFATEDDESVILSQNAIRIPCKQTRDGGYVYAYLMTWVGQTLLKKDEFGITVKHIRPHHVDGVPIPAASAEARKRIGDKIRKAFRLRAQAMKLIDDAKSDVYALLGVTEEPLDEETAESE